MNINKNLHPKTLLFYTSFNFYFYNTLKICLKYIYIMNLYKTEFSSLCGKGVLDKMLINCENKSYYELENFLYKSDDDKSVVIKALNKKGYDIVLKFNTVISIQKEYAFGNELAMLPNFIRFFCKIECMDNIVDIIKHEKNIKNYNICTNGQNEIGILVMKYYRLGNLKNFDWNENNFILIINVIKQVIYAIVNAYFEKKFLHNDLWQ